MSAPFNKAATIVISLAASIASSELAAQAGFAFFVKPGLDAQRANPLHYYQASADPAFCYELKPGYRGERDGKRIALNRFGIRDDSDHETYAQTLAVLGDSVPFGINLSQDETVPARVQELAGPDLKVLNFGTPGYGLEEIRRLLEAKYAIYSPRTIYYLMNLNDFSRRDTVYEGADNGLYRMYCPPGLKLPFLARKLIYRFNKGAAMSSVGWYRWMYDGNKTAGLAIVKQMADFTSRHGGRFVVALLPPRVAFQDRRFLLSEQFDEIRRYLTAQGIPSLAPIDDFAVEPQRLQDETDHFTPDGSRVMANAIWKDVSKSE